MKRPNHIVEIPLNVILPRKDNVRQVYDGIEELAETIHRHGLLQNLVLHPAGDGLRYMVAAGNRRFRAMCLLATQSRPYNPGPDGITRVPCLIKNEEDFNWVNVIENMQRQDVPVWHLGLRFREMTDSGLRQVDIAQMMGLSQGKVSRYIIIASNLAPATIVRLDQIRGYAWKESNLTTMANMINKRTGDPDEKAQLQYLDMLLGDPKTHARHKKRSFGMEQGDRLRSTVFTRYRKLKKDFAGAKTSADERRIVESVVRYLEGSDNTLKL